MRHFGVQRFARLTLYAALAQSALACGADSDHGPPIGAPTGPIGPIVNEGGSPNGGINAGGANSNGGAAPDGTGAGDTAGAVGQNPFGVGGNGSAGANPFGVGGNGTGLDQFGVAGTPSPFAGSFF